MFYDFSDLILDAVPPPPIMIPAPFVAGAYHRVGWHPVPVKSGSKATYMKNVTGRYEKNLSLETLSTIGLNDSIGLRLPHGVIGIDVDAYHDNGAGWRELVSQIGEPGPSYRSSSKMNDPISGIRYFTVPLDLKIPSGYPPAHIDFITHNYRTAIVYPSVHPKTKQIYRWWDENGNLADVDDSGFDIPFVEELHELSPPWVQWIQELSSVAEGASTGDGGYTLRTTCNTLTSDYQSQEPNGHGNERDNTKNYLQHPTDAVARWFLWMDRYGEMSEGCWTELREVVRNGISLELNGQLPPGTVYELAVLKSAANGLSERRGIDQVLGRITEQIEYAREHYRPPTPRSPFKTTLNHNQLLHRVELVAADTGLNAIQKEAFYLVAAYCYDKNYYYSRVCTRAVAKVMPGIYSTYISRYMHRWEDRGHGILKPGEKGDGPTKVSNLFHFALDYLPMTAPENPTVNLDDYRERASQISRYWEK